MRAPGQLAQARGHAGAARLEAGVTRTCSTRPPARGRREELQPGRLAAAAG